VAIGAVAPPALGEDAIARPVEITRPGADELPPRAVGRETLPAAEVPGEPVAAPVPDQQTSVVTPAEPPVSEPGPVFPVSGVQLLYAQAYPAAPLLEDVAAQTRVSLTRLPSGFAAPRPDQPTEQIPLAALGRDGQPAQLHVSAIRTISEAVVRTLNDKGFGGVFVFPDPQQFDAQLSDLREDQQLDMIVSLEAVTSAKTTAIGPRFEGREEVTNLPAHRRLLDQSPIQPYQEGTGGGLLRLDDLDDYALWLNRHPGRRVDVAITADETAQTPGAELDYLVYEARPWRIYAQTSNTGTDSTSTWRTQLGYANYQLTNNDDVLTLDYITAGFDATHSVLASYEAPLLDARRVRYRISGSWSDYVASELGPFRDDFSGTTWGLGGELAWNFYQDGPLFLDVFSGVRWQNLEVDNELVAAESQINLYEMDLGLRAERIGETSGISGTTSLSWTLEQDGDLRELTILGRTLPDEHWTILQWGVNGYWYLEPLLNRQAWEDPATPGSTLAHELTASFRGQYAFENRLIPQKQQVAGGFYTVRGYPEAAAVGDTVLIGSAEYRFHIPRVFKPEPDPETTALFGKPFRFSPEQPYGRADWDLIFRAFVDAGRTMNSDPLFFEEDHTLVGTGVGLELVVLQNLSVRADWGVALKDLESGDNDVEAGDNRFHFVFTVLY
jgi:hemolysin activation/secretion protein